MLTGKKLPPNTHLFHPKFHPLVSSPLHDEVVGSVRLAMLALPGAAGFVLLIACGNVANLLLAKAEGIQKETSIRTAMGADNGALLRQFFLEGLLLSLAAVLGLIASYGPERADVLRMVPGQGMILGAAGVAAGAAGAWGLTRFLSGLLFGVDSLDPVTFAGMGAALAAVVLVACLFPARRATRVDPMVALRYE
jgi:ABC-type antimicrobial peptide transport system permease subunit